MRADDTAPSAVSIDVVFANRAEDLLGALADALAREHAERGVFAPASVVVGSRSQAKFLARAVAAQNGITFNLRPTLLPDFFATLADSPIVTARNLLGPLVELLSSEIVRSDLALDRVRRFVDGGDPAARAVKVGALASLLSHTFEQYEWWRPDLLESWPVSTTDRSPDEVWQRALFLALSPSENCRARAIHIFELLALVRTGSIKTPSSVHCFMTGAAPPVALAVLEALAKRSTVRIYAWNPSEEFWDEPSADEPLSLARLGASHRSHVASLHKVVEWDTRTVFFPPEGTSVLARVKREAFRCGRDADGGHGTEDDRTVQVFACGSPRREIDVAVREIHTFLRADSSIRTDDVALVLAGREWATYLPHVQGAFSSARNLAYSLALSPGHVESDAVVAYEKLLSILTGDFRRAEVISLLLRPSFASGLTESDTAQIERYCDELGIYGGKTRDDLEGTYVEDDSLTWSQGLVRLALGSVLDSTSRERFAIGEFAYAPLPIEDSELAVAMRCALVVRSLIADAVYATAKARPIAEWVVFLRALLRQYIEPRTARGNDDLIAIDTLLRDLGGSGGGTLRAGTPVPFGAVRDVIFRELQDFAAFGGGSGIVVGPLSELHAIPFRMVVIVGLGCDLSPEGGGFEAFDLRRNAPRPSDLSPELVDRGRLLQVMLAARERVVLTYPGRDPKSGEETLPAPALADLIDVLTPHRSPGVAAVTREPLARHEERAALDDRDAPIPEAAAEAQASRLGASIALAAGGAVTRGEVLSALEEQPLAGLRSWFKLPTVRGAEQRVARATTELPLSLLRQFLADPIEAYARVQAGVTREDAEDEETEPLATSAREEGPLLRQAFALAEGGAVSREEAYERATRAGRRSATQLSGIFLSAERTRHLRILATWATQVHLHAPPSPKWLEARIGRASLVEDAAAPRLELPPLELPSVPGTTLRITGQTGLVSISPCAALTLSPSADIKPPGSPEGAQALLRPFVDHVVLAAAGVGGDRPRDVVMTTAGPHSPATRLATFSPIERERAVEYLAGLAADLLSPVRPFRFPSTAVFEWREQNGAQSLAEAIAREANAPRSASVSWRKVTAPELYPVPREDEARAIAERRFGLFWASLELGKK